MNIRQQRTGIGGQSMSNDFYASPQGAMAMHGVGRNLGRAEGWRNGYDEGLSEGVALGRRQTNEAIQPQLNQLISRVHGLEARIRMDNQNYFALAVVALSSIESLGSASHEQQVTFVKAYLRLCKEAADKKLFAMPPDANQEFARANPVLANFVRETFATAMQQEANRFPRP
jgi:hypothetical protein